MTPLSTAPSIFLLPYFRFTNTACGTLLGWCVCLSAAFCDFSSLKRRETIFRVGGVAITPFFCRLSAMIAHAPLGPGCFRLLGNENWFFFDIFCHGIMKENQFFEYIDSQLIPIPTFFAIEPALLPLSVLSVARRHFNEFVAVSVKEVWYGKQRRVSYCSFQ